MPKKETKRKRKETKQKGAFKTLAKSAKDFLCARTSEGDHDSRSSERDVDEEGRSNSLLIEGPSPSKKTKKNKNPFGVPPSSCTREVFQLQQPFIKVVFSNDVAHMEGDKVQGEDHMDADALRTAIDALSDDFLRFSRSSKAPSSELGYRDLHTALARSFWLLTRPQEKCTLSAQGIADLDVKRTTTIQKHEDETDHGHMDLNVVAELVDDCRSDSGDRPSTASLDIRIEGDEGERNINAKKGVKYDIKFQVYDSGIEGLDKMLLVLIVECKYGSLSVEDIYQVASYACSLIGSNLQKGRFYPLHMEVWSELGWRYATLYPLGLVEVKDNEVQAVKVSKSSKTYFATKLEERKKGIGEYGEFEYPDGEYLDGVLYISTEKFTLPGLHTEGALTTSDSKLFFESKMRIIIGDKVLKWTKEDVSNALRVRMEMLKKEKAKLMG